MNFENQEERVMPNDASETTGSAHTPGPWHFCGNERGGCSCSTVLCADYPVAKVTLGAWGDDYPSIRLVGGSLELKAEAFMEQITYGEVSKETAVANARLIAAAPEMIDALRQWAVAEKLGDEQELANARHSRDAAIANAIGAA